MHRLIASCLTGLALLSVIPARVVAQTIPSGCDSIAGVPATYAIDYQQDIQPIFSFGCANCHVDSAGDPEADLDLDPDPSWFNLVDVNSSQDASQIRVIAGDALRSLLFRKVNCDVPGPGPDSQRMPQNRPDLQLADQALIYDWIMAGAPNGPTDTLFYNSFELRGFVP
ncbi:MAG: hypothetical protein ABIP49_06495 [Lysobacterales bacterium]